MSSSPASLPSPTSSRGAAPGPRSVSDGYRRWVAGEIGPRRVGGRYRCGYSGDVYEVLAVDRGPRPHWPTWQITVRSVGSDHVRRHCTAWDPQRDQVLEDPQDPEAALAWGAWELAYPTASRLAPGEAAELRHLLDEIAHPFTTSAFHRLACTGRDAATPAATEESR